MINIVEDDKKKLYVFKDTGEVVQPQYLDYEYDNYIDDGLEFFELMSAKPPLKDEDLEIMLNSDKYIAEEKLDGVRQSMLIQEEGSRLFSRRISKATNWYCENTNSVPHLKRLCSKEYEGTIIDGEFKIDNKGFKEVSSTMNCNWDLAIERQLEFGFVTLHTFDIIYYKGVYVAKMPLERRKQLLRKVVKELDNPYVEETPYMDSYIKVPFNKDIPCVKKQQENLTAFRNLYPNLFSVIGEYSLVELQQGKCISLNKQQWYEYIVANGGEGMMLKDKKGIYQHKRGREYTKMKKWSSWDCVICGFTPPTKKYNGDHLESWEYWEYTDKGHKKIHEGVGGRNLPNAIPVSKYYAKGWVGNLEFGVYVIYDNIEEFFKKFGEEGYNIMSDNEEVKHIGDKIYHLLKVGECSGFDEETREYFTNNKDKLLYKTVEIKAQELIDKKKGTLRHPDYLRLREDKDPLVCTLKEHISQ